MSDHSRKPGWTWVKFGDVVKLNTGRCADPLAEGIERYVGLEHIEPEDLRIRRWGLVAEGTTFTNRFQPGQVLFGKRRAYQRKVAVADFEGVCSGDIYVFEPKNERLLPELLPFLCQTDGFFEHAIGTSAGSLSPRTNWTQLADYEFALPPMEEQRRITAILAKAYEYGENLQIAIQELITLRDALIKQRATELTKNGLTQFRTIIAQIESGTSPGGSGRSAQENEYGVLKVSAVGNWDFRPEENKVIQDYEYHSELEVCTGDLLATRANADPASVGRTCIVGDTRPGLMLSDKTWRLNVATNKKYNKIGVLAWTKSAIFRQYVQKSLGGTDAKNISQKAFLDGPFPLCSEVAFNSFASEIESILMSEKLLNNQLSQTRKIIEQLYRQCFGDSHV